MGDEKGEATMAKPKAERKKQQPQNVVLEVETLKSQDWLGEMMETNARQFELATTAVEMWQGQFSRAVDSSLAGIRDSYDQWYHGYTTWMNSLQAGNEMVSSAWQNGMEQMEHMYRSWR